ncbi:hypothetical protein MXAN_5173 [Myxococcus xanthus DK 1622]|uniref:HEXXH motif domain-containing protein n=1 Tax=Myxococcus xanthus (strain DK1622) TaxID=246197 RepID=Q1D1Z7_MYXXD|nr:MULTISPECIES: HEXXH motif-containing putative peptide modification protein [Myxococcus]ABF86661.1 hypothetical protein MXAN_5173 [Myxococcus xanthus DK 1622]NOJ55897.1 HEXXH motif domain-containing protein [Myxococcus xanthus]QPM77679.1 HEXXH motif domain-containing protein [Myxococcus xanthus]QVW66745.1 HEXXH motif domain-containing protein [Myxococcus xanthus DZ2]QZZ52841.1 hypothetical protein MyxoNM_26870 [Myxococcus xanthus]
MQFQDAFTFPTPLSPETEASARELLRAQQMGQLDLLMGWVQQPERLGKLGGCATELQSLLSEAFELVERAPALAREFLEHWSTTVLLGRLLGPAAVGPGLIQCLMGNLASLLIVQRLRGEVTHGEAFFVTPRTLYCLPRGERLDVRGPGEGRVVWHFSGAECLLSVEGHSGPGLRIPLPLMGDAPVSIQPLPWSETWNVPVLDDSEMLGITGRRDQAGIPDDGSTGTWRPMPLLQSTEEAFHILGKLWPEVLDWARVLLPALVDMGGPENRSVRCSSSYGAGTPVFLTRVANGLEHAEDLVHELQHERMYLLLDSRAFGRWDDSRPEFVSAYRTDPRPLRGVHLGLHSFLAVNRLRLLALDRPEFKQREWRFQLLKSHRCNLLSFRTLLDFERPTPEGRVLLAQMAQALSEQHPLIERVADADMDQAFDTWMKQHFSRVAASGPVVNDAETYMGWREAAVLAARYTQHAGGAA